MSIAIAESISAPHAEQEVAYMQAPALALPYCELHVYNLATGDESVAVGVKVDKRTVQGPREGCTLPRGNMDVTVDLGIKFFELPRPLTPLNARWCTSIALNSAYICFTS